MSLRRSKFFHIEITQLIYAACAGIALGAAYFQWQSQKTLLLNQASALLEIQEISAAKLIQRDIEDLEQQLFRSKPKTPKGSFSFESGDKALWANYSTLPKQPIQVGLDSKLPFAHVFTSLNKGNFFIVNDNGEMISKSDDLSADLSRAVVLAVKSKQQIDIPGWLSRKHKIEGSNLFLVSLMTVGHLSREATQSVLGLLCVAGIFLLLMLTYRVGRRKKEEQLVNYASDWLRNLMYSRIGTSRSLPHLDQWQKDLLTRFTKILNEESPLKSYLKGRWINKEQGLVTWRYFLEVSKEWAQGFSLVSGGRDETYSWFVAGIKLAPHISADPVFKSFQRALMLADVNVCQVSEREILFTGRNMPLVHLNNAFRTALNDALGRDLIKATDIGLACTWVQNEMVESSKDSFVEDLIEMTRKKTALMQMRGFFELSVFHAPKVRTLTRISDIFQESQVLHEGSSEAPLVPFEELPQRAPRSPVYFKKHNVVLPPPPSGRRIAAPKKSISADKTSV